jgi:hypothetical protein
VIALINKMATEIDFIRCNLIFSKKYIIVFLLAMYGKKDAPRMRNISMKFKMILNSVLG